MPRPRFFVKWIRKASFLAGVTIVLELFQEFC